MTRSDFHAVGDPFLVPDDKGIMKSVTTAIKCWLEFAEAAGLPMRDAGLIQYDFMIDA